MAHSHRYVLGKDRNGVIWDLLLYIPTVGGLGAGSAAFWYSQNYNMSYLLLFLSCFFLYQGIHRVLGRLNLLPAAPIALDVSKKRVVLDMRNGEKVELVKDLRYFSDYAGKSFGLSGMDLSGKRRQFVLHKGHFSNVDEFKQITAELRIFT